ncbi:MAG: hypothetical protein K0Q43_1952 [Ramlibacter sp.]|nr:hypothetical protein [Ramlibacter sp.]
MTHKAQTSTKPNPKPELAFALEPDVIHEPGEILERPDGYYWRSPEGPGEYGPFDSFEAAMADRDSMGDTGSSRLKPSRPPPVPRPRSSTVSTPTSCRAASPLNWRTSTSNKGGHSPSAST